MHTAIAHDFDMAISIDCVQSQLLAKFEYTGRLLQVEVKLLDLKRLKREAICKDSIQFHCISEGYPTRHQQSESAAFIVRDCLWIACAIRCVGSSCGVLYDTIWPIPTQVLSFKTRFRILFIRLWLLHPERIRRILLIVLPPVIRDSWIESRLANSCRSNRLIVYDRRRSLIFWSDKPHGFPMKTPLVISSDHLTKHLQWVFSIRTLNENSLLKTLPD